MPLPQLLVRRNGGAPQTGGIEAAYSDVVQLTLASTSGVQQYLWQITSYPPGWSCPTGWTVDPVSGYIYQSTAAVPPAFTLPASSTWGKWLLSVTVNGDQTQVDVSTGLEILSSKGLHDIAIGEVGQFGGLYPGWAYQLQLDLRVIDGISGGGGGSVSPGAAFEILGTNSTGSAVAWTYLVDANVATGAGIQGSKIAPDFGAQAVKGSSFTGTSGKAWQAGEVTVDLGTATGGLLTLTTGQVESHVIRLGGTPSVPITVFMEAGGGEYVFNNLSGQTVTILAVGDGGAGVTIPAASGALVYLQSGNAEGLAFGGAGGSFTPAGDLSGSATHQTVAGLQGVGLDPTTVGGPASGAFLVYNGPTYVARLLAFTDLPTASGAGFLTTTGGSGGGWSSVASAQGILGCVLANGSVPLSAAWALGSHAITGGVLSSDPTSLVPRSYVDAAIQGLSPKPSVKYSTTAALPSNTYANGTAGVGATLTMTATGALSAIDGVGPGLGDRVLVKNEGTAANNGIYAITTLGATGVAAVFTRTPDCNTAAELGGAFVFVEDGTINTATAWVVGLDAAAITVGTTAIAWTQLASAGSYTATAPITKTGSAFGLSIPGSAGFLYSNATTDSWVTTAAAMALLQGSIASLNISQLLGAGTNGSLAWTNGSGVPAWLAPTTNGYVLTLSGGLPVWAAASGGYTPPTSTGFPHITSGAQDGAARAVNLASSDVANQLALANIASGGSAGFFYTNGSGTNAFASLATTAALISPSLSGLTLSQLTIGTAYQIPIVNAGATAAAWGAPDFGPSQDVLARSFQAHAGSAWSAGRLAIALPSASNAMTLTSGQMEALVLEFTGSPTMQVTVTIPATAGLFYVILNSNTAGLDIIIKAVGDPGSGVRISPGYSAQVYLEAGSATQTNPKIPLTSLALNGATGYSFLWTNSSGVQSWFGPGSTGQILWMTGSGPVWGGSGVNGQFLTYAGGLPVWGTTITTLVATTSVQAAAFQAPSGSAFTLTASGVAIASTATTLTAAQSALPTLIFTGALTGNSTVILNGSTAPVAGTRLWLTNSCTGACTLYFQGLYLPPGLETQVVYNGTSWVYGAGCGTYALLSYTYTVVAGASIGVIGPTSIWQIPAGWNIDYASFYVSGVGTGGGSWAAALQTTVSGLNHADLLDSTGLTSLVVGDYAENTGDNTAATTSPWLTLAQALANSPPATFTSNVGGPMTVQFKIANSASTTGTFTFVFRIGIRRVGA